MLIASGVIGFLRSPVIGSVVISWGLLVLPTTDRFLADRGWTLNLWKRLGLILVGCVLIGISAPNHSTKQASVDSISNTSMTGSDNSQRPTQIVTPKAASFTANVYRKGIDSGEGSDTVYSYYQALGKVDETLQSISLNYVWRWECGEGKEQARQEKQVVFNLVSKIWSSKARNLSWCIEGVPINPEWSNQDMESESNPFTIEKKGIETIIKADQRADGSIFLKDHLVVKYIKPQ